MKCIDGCNREAQKNKSHCYFCDPTIPDEEKKQARARGGYHSRHYDHNLASEDVLPINDVRDLKRFLNVLLAQTIDEISDIDKMSKITLPIIDRFSEIFQIELVEEMNSRLKLIEAKQDGRLIESTYENTD